MTPVIEIERIPADIDTGAPKRSAKDQVERSIKALTTCWGEQRCFLDLVFLESEVVGGTTAAEHAYDGARKAGHDFVPVARLGMPAKESAALTAHMTNGIALRLTSSDFAAVGAAIAVPGLKSFLESISVSEGDVDLLIDLAALTMPTATIQATIVAMVNGISNIAAYRSLTVLGSGFPSSVSNVVQRESVDFEPRSDYTSWEALYLTWSHASNTGSALPIARMPTYGDYGIQYPVELAFFDPRYMKTSAQIRYTLPDQWYLARGLSYQDNGGAQYKTMAEALVATHHFYGKDHCWGCELCDAVATGTGTAASPEMWRSIGTCHHLTLTSEQIAGLP